MINKQYSIARKNKDKKFDGKFFFGVKTTGIFCRPSCPSPVAKEDNVTYFATIYEPLNAGYRPCLRCRPDIYTEKAGYNIDGTDIVKKAVSYIAKGYLNDNSVVDLANELGTSDRHLRKLFKKEVGCSPIQIAKFHRAIFAKKLLLSSNLNMTNIAFASGFGSIRQFNNVFCDIYEVNPTDFRKNHGVNMSKGNVMFLPYDNTFDFEKIISFMKPRLIKGVEVINDAVYSRTFKLKDTTGHFCVKDNKEKSSLELEVFCENMNIYMDIYYKVKRMFDMDTDIGCISEHFSDDKLLNGYTVPRLPVAFDPYEFTIRAILGQQISVKAATTLAMRIVCEADITYTCNIKGLTHIFPYSDDIECSCLDDIGITKTRVNTIRHVNEALKKEIFSLKNDQSYEKFSKEFGSIKGIGDWTVNYVAMRGLGMADAFPANDLGVVKALAIDDKKPTTKEIIAIAEKWRPYRAYATLCLWSKEV